MYDRLVVLLLEEKLAPDEDEDGESTVGDDFSELDVDIRDSHSPRRILKQPWSREEDQALVQMLAHRDGNKSDTYKDFGLKVSFRSCSLDARVVESSC